MNLRSLAAALVLAVALLAALAASQSDYIGPAASIPAILGFISLSLFGWAVYLHHRAILLNGAYRALLHVAIWLSLLMIVLPNLTMLLLLYGGQLAVIVAPFAVLIFLTGSIYYLLPYAIFGESMFLDETVISPNGMGGILASMFVWAVVVIVALFALHSLAIGWSSQKHG